MQIVSSGDNLHEMLYPIILSSKKKYYQFIICWISTEGGMG